MFIAIMFGLLTFTSPSFAAEKQTPVYRYLWSHYAGWEPWQYAMDSGIMKKWADKYGVKIEVTLINDYVTSINQYTAGQAVGCAMTIMDLLDMPAVGGVDSEVLVVGDYSNGNDGVCLVNGKTFSDIKGRNVLIVQGSVSSYVLSRGLEKFGMKNSDVKEVNTSDSNIGATFASSGSKGACVTWNPILMNVRNLPNVSMVFDSSKIPGEVQDLLVVRRDTPEPVKKALVGAWYETMMVMSGQGKQTDEAIESMAKFAGGTVAEFKAQLRTTFMFYGPNDGIKFVESKENQTACRNVMNFCFEQGLLGQGVKSADYIGIEFPNGVILGDPKNVKIRYITNYMKLAAEGKL
jgi:NitT/TauT family transport system substrate-binding protein